MNIDWIKALPAKVPTEAELRAVQERREEDRWKGWRRLADPPNYLRPRPRPVPMPDYYPPYRPHYVPGPDWPYGIVPISQGDVFRLSVSPVRR